MKEIFTVVTANNLPSSFTDNLMIEHRSKVFDLTKDVVFRTLLFTQQNSSRSNVEKAQQV